MIVKSLSVFLRTTIIFCLLLLLIGVNQEALSGQEGHGGETVDIDGRPVLRDFVDSTSCEWIRAEDFVTDLAAFPEILSSIRKIHWYFSDVISREILDAELTVCQTWAELKKIPTEDRDGVTIVELDTKQVAIRINDMIFIDMSLFEELDDDSKAYLFLHEVMHSFLPLDTPRRNGKLRSMISTIRKNQVVPMSKEDFGLQMEMNSVAVTPATEPFDDQKENILKATDPQANEVERMVAAYKAFSKANYLWSDDQKTIAQFKEQHITRYENAVREGKFNEIWEGILFTGFDVNKIIYRQYYHRIDSVNPLIVAVEKGDLETIIKLSQLPNIRFDVEREIDEYEPGPTGWPETKRSSRDSLIIIAFLHQYVDVLKWLLTRNDIFIPASIFRTAYDKDYFEIFKALCDHTDVNKPFVDPGVTLLMLSVSDPAKLRYFQYLMTRKDVDVNIQASDGATALHHAVRARNIDAVRELLKHPRINPFLKLNGSNNSFLCWEYVSGDFTPREFADELDYEEIEKILEEFEDSLDD